MPLFHPAAALYTPSNLQTLRDDFARIPELLALDPPPQPEIETAPVPEIEREPVPEAEPEPAPETEHARAPESDDAEPEAEPRQASNGTHEPSEHTQLGLF